MNKKSITVAQTSTFIRQTGRNNIERKYKNGLGYISTSYRVTGLHFCCWYCSLDSHFCGGLQKTHLSTIECVLAVQVIVDDFGTNQKRLWNFQIVLSCIVSEIPVAVLGKNIWGGGLAPHHLGGNNG